MTIETVRSHARCRVLIVNDAAAPSSEVTDCLQRAGFEVAITPDGTGALRLARSTAPDVVVLDIVLPDIDGLWVCRELRSFSDAYVVLGSMCDSASSVIAGLTAGADDVVRLPWHAEELLARIRAMLRRPRRHDGHAEADTGAGRGEVRVFGTLSIDVEARRVVVGDEPVALTRTEFDILAALSARPAAVVSRHELLATVWGRSWAGEKNVIDVHIGHLRRKLEDDPAVPRFVVNVRGAGYRMGTG